MGVVPREKETANIVQEFWPQHNGRRAAAALCSPPAASVDKLHGEYFKCV